MDAYLNLLLFILQIIGAFGGLLVLLVLLVLGFNLIGDGITAYQRGYRGPWPQQLALGVGALLALVGLLPLWIMLCQTWAPR